MEKIVYIPGYDNGWDVMTVKVKSAWTCGSRSILINGEFYWNDQLFKSSDAAWKWIGKIHVPDSDRYTIEELLN